MIRAYCLLFLNNQKKMKIENKKPFIAVIKKENLAFYIKAGKILGCELETLGEEYKDLLEVKFLDLRSGEAIYYRVAEMLYQQATRLLWRSTN